MLHISETPALRATVYADSVLRWQCTHNIIICILGKLEIITHKTSYGLLTTVQGNHLKLQISRINNVSFYQSKKESQVLVTEECTEPCSCEFPFLAQGEAWIMMHLRSYHSAAWLWILAKDPELRTCHS